MIRLLTGIINLSIFYYFGVDVNPYLKAKYERETLRWFTETFGDIGETLYYISLVIFASWIFYQGLIGIFRIITWDEIPSWAKGIKILPQLKRAFYAFLNGINHRSSYHHQNGNINRVIQYRESKLGTMGQRKAADELLKSSGLDYLNNSTGKNTARAASYLNSKLGTMGQKEGYEYVKKKFGG